MNLISHFHCTIKKVDLTLITILNMVIVFVGTVTVTTHSRS
jgi:hypothetical protein